MFHAIKVFPESIYYAQEDEAIIVYQQEGHTLHLYDVVSQGDVNINRLLNRIATEQTEIVHFHFTPDQFTEQAEYEPMDNNDDMLFIKSNFVVDTNLKFCVPMFAHA